MLPAPRGGMLDHRPGRYLVWHLPWKSLQLRLHHLEVYKATAAVLVLVLVVVEEESASHALTTISVSAQY